MNVAEFNGILTLAIFVPIIGSLIIAIFFSGITSAAPATVVDEKVQITTV